MSRTELTSFMKSAGLSPVDIASIAKVHQQTIVRFLKGQSRLNPSALFLIETYVKQVQENKQAKAVAG